MVSRIIKSKWKGNGTSTSNKLKTKIFSERKVDKSKTGKISALK